MFSIITVFFPLFWASLVFAGNDNLFGEVEPRHNHKSGLGHGASARFHTLVVAHAVVCVIGFAVCLPAGALLARYLRTFRSWWYAAHWLVQFVIAGSFILPGVILGYMASSEYGKTPGDAHKTLGTVLLVLYFHQCALGALIHYWKPKSAAIRRPMQNYLHAIIGLVIIALGMYQIRTGYAAEWPKYTGRGRLPSGVNSLWVVWVILLPIAYGAGMWFIRLQYQQEAEARLLLGTTGGEDRSNMIMKRMDLDGRAHS